MLTIVGILTFISRINYQFLRFEPEFSTNFDYFSIFEQMKFHAQLSSKTSFITSWPGVWTLENKDVEQLHNNGSTLLTEPLYEKTNNLGFQ